MSEPGFPQGADESPRNPNLNGGELPGNLHVAIAGLGLMGGSLALALKPHCRRITGIDPDPNARALALERKAVDAALPGLEGLDGDVGLLILAAPVRTILNLAARLAELPQTAPGLVVLDIGSTKQTILEAFSRLPAHFDPLGGHPMCGKESSGMANADPNLYQGAPFALCPLPRTSPRARALAESLAAAVGALPLWLDAATHDRWVAATSHLPYLLSAALVNATPAEAAPLVGPGFRGMARLAGSDPAMMLDILTTNRSEIRTTTARLRSALDALEAGLDNEESLAAQIHTARQKQNQMLKTAS